MLIGDMEGCLHPQQLCSNLLFRHCFSSHGEHRNKDKLILRNLGVGGDLGGGGGGGVRGLVQRRVDNLQAPCQLFLKLTAHPPSPALPEFQTATPQARKSYLELKSACRQQAKACSGGKRVLPCAGNT